MCPPKLPSTVGRPERSRTSPMESLEGPGIRDPAAAPVPAAQSALDDPGEDALDPSEERDSIFSVFSAATRKGPWEPPARLQVFTLFGGAELDFCEADMLEGTTRVDVFVLFGGAQIRVPPDIDVDSKGLGIFGQFAQHSQRGNGPDPPRLMIRGTALFGGVDVKGPKRKGLRFGRRGRKQN